MDATARDSGSGTDGPAPSPLARLLAPFDEARFLGEVRGRRPLVVPASDRSRFDAVFGLDSAEEYLYVARPPAGDLRLVRSGAWPPLERVKGLFGNSAQYYDLPAVYEALAAGYTVVLNGVHFRWPPLRALTADLEEQLLASVQANVYLTGPNAQGFSRHTDDHEVIVLQTHGRKRWQVFAPAADPRAEPSLLHDIELAQGDLLYLPMGFPHAASTSSAYSLHVTLGVFSLTWRDLAGQVLDRAAGQDAWWHQPVLVPRPTADVEPAKAFAERLRRMAASAEDPAELLERHRLAFTTGPRRRGTSPGGHLRSLAALDDLHAGTKLARRAGATCLIQEAPAGVDLHFLDTVIRVPPQAAAAARFIAATPRFRVRDIDPALSPESALVLVRRLIREGLLETVGDDEN